MSKSKRATAQNVATVLKCRKGDLALIISSKRGNEGRLVTVEEFWGDASCDGIPTENVWAVSIAGQTHNPETGKSWIAPDHTLLPIRPGDLEETEVDELSLEDRGE